MGYYSEVVLAVHEDAVESFETVCAKLVADANTKFRFAEYKAEGVVYQWPSLKWYEEFPEIRAYYEWANLTDSEMYCFIRLGEDTDDVEYGGHLDCGMYVERQITVPSRIWGLEQQPNKG